MHPGVGYSESCLAALSLRPCGKIVGSVVLPVIDHRTHNSAIAVSDVVHRFRLKSFAGDEQQSGTAATGETEPRDPLQLFHDVRLLCTETQTIRNLRRGPQPASQTEPIGLRGNIRNRRFSGRVNHAGQGTNKSPSICDTVADKANRTRNPRDLPGISKKCGLAASRSSSFHPNADRQQNVCVALLVGRLHREHVIARRDGIVKGPLLDRSQLQ